MNNILLLQMYEEELLEILELYLLSMKAGFPEKSEIYKDIINGATLNMQEYISNNSYVTTQGVH